MKKLLSLLGAVALTASSASIVVSCSYAPTAKSEADREANFYANVSAEAMKSGILADQNLDIYGNPDAGVDIDFANDHFGAQTITSALGSLYGKDQGAKPGQTSDVSSLFGSTFGRTSTDANGYKYSIKDSFGSLKANNGVAKNTNLYDLINNGDKSKRLNELQKPNSSIASTLNLVSGLGNLVFKNDFDPSIGETLIGLLGTSTVQNAVKGDSIANIFHLLDNALTQNGTSISDLITSVTQEKLAQKVVNDSQHNNYSDVLSSQTSDLFGSLIYFISNKKFLYNADPKAGIENNDGFTTFTTYLQDVINKKSDAEIKKDCPHLEDAKYSFSSWEIDDTKLTISFTGNADDINASSIIGVGPNKQSLGAPKVDSNKSTVTFNLGKEPSLGDTYSFTYGAADSSYPLGSITIAKDSDGNMKGSVTNLLYSDLIESASGIVSFAVTLLHYFRQFDAVFPRVYSPIDGNHIFGDDTLNGDAITKILEMPYVSSPDKLKAETTDKNGDVRTAQDDFWYVTKNQNNSDSQNTIMDTDNNSEQYTFYSKFNLQNLISDLQYYLSPVDSTGHQTLRFFSMLLGGPDGKLNPILQDVFNVAKGFGKDTLANLIKNIPYVGPFLASKADAIATAIVQLIQNASTDLMNWFTSDGDNPTAQNVSNIIKQITGLVGSLDLPSFTNDEPAKKILVIVNGIMKYLNSSDGDEFYAHPWSTIYGNSLLSSVGKIMINASNYETDDSTKNLDRRIGRGMQQLRDIKSVLTMSFKDLASTLSSIINTVNPGNPGYKQIAVPDWLYLTNKKSIAGIVDYLANDAFAYVQDGGTDNQVSHSSNALNTLAEDKYFSFNSRSLSSLVNTLIPGTNANEQNVRIWYAKDGTSPTDDSSLTTDSDHYFVSPIMPIYYSIMNTGATSTDGLTVPFSGTYTAFVPGDTKSGKIVGHQILNSATFKDPDNKEKTTIVSARAFQYLLGLDDFSSNTTMFMQGSLLMAVSNLYGHWYKTTRDENGTVTQTVDNDSVESDSKIGTTEYVNANAQGVESLFGVFSDVAKLANDSITQLTNDVYGKYFDPKHWRITGIKQIGLDVQDANASDTQQLDYNLAFYNPDLGKWVTYHVTMQRQATNINTVDNPSNVGWVVVKLMLQN